MRGPTRLLISLAVAATSVLGLGGTATAGTDVTVTADPVTYTQLGTFTGSVDVSGLNPAATYDVLVSDPTGATLVEETDVSGEATHHLAPQLTVGDNPAGTYTVTVSTDATPVASGTFRVIEPVLTLRRYTRREMDVRLTLDGVGMGHRVVHVQEYFNHRWNDQGGIWTTRGGWVGIICNRHHRCTHSFKFAYRSFVFSDVFQLYTGPRNGRYADLRGSSRIAVG